MQDSSAYETSEDNHQWRLYSEEGIPLIIVQHFVDRHWNEHKLTQERQKHMHSDIQTFLAFYLAKSQLEQPLTMVFLLSDKIVFFLTLFNGVYWIKLLLDVKRKSIGVGWAYTFQMLFFCEHSTDQVEQWIHNFGYKLTQEPNCINTILIHCERVTNSHLTLTVPTISFLIV